MVLTKNADDSFPLTRKHIGKSRTSAIEDCTATYANELPDFYKENKGRINEYKNALSDLTKSLFSYSQPLADNLATWILRERGA